MENPSDDVVVVASGSNDLLASLSDKGEKPLMMLFRRLIGNDTKQNTVLTNAQIIDILQKEFNMEIIYVHELEIDIYLNIVKKFLKDWPQWDEFDTSINLLKSKKDFDKIKTMLDANYESLKEYLKSVLETVKPLLKQTIKEVKQETVQKDNVMEDDVTMQLQCTRQQLNHLFFRRPHPLFRNTIFNTVIPPPKIRLTTIALEAMLNWPNICIIINIGGAVIIRRDMILSLKHILVNKKLNYANRLPELLKDNIQMRGHKKATTNLSVETYMSIMDDISSRPYWSNETKQVMKAVADLLKSDLETAPEKLLCPITYRQILNKFSYVRYLYSDVNTNAFNNVNNFDLQLEETGVPQLHINIAKVQKANEIPLNGSFLKIECIRCDAKMSGSSILTLLRQHFEEYHLGEVDWQCSKCRTTYPMEYLAKMKWRHQCLMSSKA